MHARVLGAFLSTSAKGCKQYWLAQWHLERLRQPGQALQHKDSSFGQAARLWSVCLVLGGLIGVHGSKVTLYCSARPQTWQANQ